MKRPKILFVTTAHYTLVAFLLPFARHFREQGWIVDGMAQGISASADCRQAFDNIWEIDWARNPLHPGNLLAAPRTLRTLVTEGNYDLVHVHTPIAAFVTRMALRGRRGAPSLVYTAHGFHFYRGGPLLRNAFFLGVERLAGRWTDYLVVMNEEDRQAALHYRILPQERLRFMPGIGIDLQQYQHSVEPAQRERVRQELGLGEANPLFLAIAEFIPRKRHQDILLAFARLARPEAHLALAGSGPLKDRMQSLAQTLGIAGRVHFLGFRRDIQSLLSASSAVILASAQEGLPRSLMEACCQGIPCIGSDIRGTRDLLEGASGLLYRLGDIDALAAAMAWILDNPEEARRRGAKGQEKMKEYDLQRILQLHEQLYAEALVKAGFVTGTSSIAAEATT